MVRREGEGPGLEYRSSVSQQEEGERKLLAGEELEMPLTACVEKWLHSQLTMGHRLSILSGQDRQWKGLSMSREGNGAEEGAGAQGAAEGPEVAQTARGSGITFSLSTTP